MPLSTRSRPPRTSAGHLANTSAGQNGHQPSAAKPTTKSSTVHHDRHPHHRARATSGHGGNTSTDVGAELPPPKRRKLSIRGRQTTLESFLVAQPKPPTKVTRKEPHGQLVQTINGVQNVLDVNDDALSMPTSRSRTPSKAPSNRHAQRLPIPDKREDKRTLRSQDEGPRLKSELAIYFPNYDEIIFEPPKEQEFIAVDSAIYITDDAPKQEKNEVATSRKSPKGVKNSPANTRMANQYGILPPTTPQRTSSNQFNGSPSLNLDFVAKTLPDDPDDPLTDDFYLKSHRRAERKEKQLRNIEKERAMHEKVQLDRLLDGLLGHDWLRVMGITAVTDLEAKKYERKRDYFIAEVKALVDKFKEWKEQEKKQKVQKETIIAVREVTEELESDESSIGPPSSDLNASAALQLQQETASAIRSAAAMAARLNKVKNNISTPTSPRTPVPFVPPPPEVPITSFFEKRHLRDAALGKARHGRSVTAFGHPIPDLAEEEFILPEDYVTHDAIRANARERRRRNRASAADGKPA